MKRNAKINYLYSLGGEEKTAKRRKKTRGITDYWHNKRRRKIATKSTTGRLKKGL